MLDSQTRLQYLYERFIRDEASPDEVREFWNLYNQEGENDICDKAFELYDDEIPEELENKDWNDAAQRIFNHALKKKVFPMNRWWYAAASIVLLLGISGYVFFKKQEAFSGAKATASHAKIVHDVQAPVSTKATIVLANGQQIFLDSSGSGRLALQNNISLNRTNDGKLQYAAGSEVVGQELIYNTLINPRGSRVVDMILSDGSHVWLNSGSSVRYPVAFTGKERKLSISGEAYFEISHDPSKKFIVESNGIETEVFGTHFNVNAYPGEDITRITLLEGSVKVVLPDGKSSMIKPGEQALKTARGELMVQKDVDVESVIAWKNSMFRFQDTNIRDIMKEVSRWYDVDIEYQGSADDFKELNFGGNMSRQRNVSELLKRLEATKAVHFEVNGKKITVIKIK